MNRSGCLLAGLAAALGGRGSFLKFCTSGATILRPGSATQQCRLLTSSPAAAAAAATAAAAESEIRYPDGKLRRLSNVWLRFNCRCAECHNADTRQRTVSPAAAIAGAAEPPRLSNLEAGGDETLGVVRIEWPADGHLSEFTYAQLDALLAPDGGGVGQGRSLWLRTEGNPLDGPAAIRPVPLEEFVDPGNGGDVGLRAVLRNLWACGVALVDGVAPTEAATEVAVRRLGAPLATLFSGGMWTFSADGGRQDTAYGCEAIGVHNDTTYLHNCAGLQVFHVLEPAPTGGQTCLADGFQAIETLRAENRRHFDLLVSRLVYHHYLEGRPASGSGGGCCGPRLAHHTRCLDTVIKLDPETGGGPYQIRYNPYDLDSLAGVPQAEVFDYLAAYAHLGEILNRPESQVWLSLQPGTLLLLDNWRVLHGRSGFSGRRVVTGCYMSRDDWMSQARVHGVV